MSFKMVSYCSAIKSLYIARFSRYKHFCVLQLFVEWPPFWARQIFLENWDGYSAEIPCGLKISSKSLYLARFSRHKHFCVLQFLRKFKMAAILGETNFFLKIGMTILQSYPVDQKFRQNRTI